MPAEGPRQSRLDTFRTPEEPAQAGDESRNATAHRPRAPAPEPAGADLAAEPIPPAQDEDRVRLQRAVREGLEAAGFQEPRVTIHLKKHASLRASLTQDQAGRILRGERLTLEITDAYHMAPERAVAGLVASLGMRVMGKRKTGDLARMLIEYHDLWQRSRDGRSLQSRIRRQRARKQGRGPHGTAHDLQALCDRLNGRFFAGRIKDVELTWSSREGYTTLGHHDGDLDTIVINRCLDHAEVPETIVAYILYHELLHHTLGIKEHPGGRRSLHPPSFRRRERRFPNWKTADEYLETMCNKRRPIPYQRAPRKWRVLWDTPWHQAPAASHEETPTATAARTRPDRAEGPA